MKKLLTILLAVCLLCGGMVVGASAADTYTITYTGGSVVPVPQTKIHGVDLILSPNIPWSSGSTFYTFVGWYAFFGYVGDYQVGLHFYQPGDVYKVNNNTQMYACWEETSFTITFDANGGECTREPMFVPRPENVPSNWFVQLGPYSVQLNPTRAGYNFLGWSTDSAATEAEYHPNGQYHDIGDVTLYAVWEKKTVTTTAPTTTTASSATTTKPVTTTEPSTTTANTVTTTTTTTTTTKAATTTTATTSPAITQPAKTIGKTSYPATAGNWFMYIFLFGWIWMK